MALQAVILAMAAATGSPGEGMSPEEFISFTTDWRPRVAAIKGERARGLLTRFRAAPASLRSRPEAKISMLNLKTMLHPPKTRAGWVRWMMETERLGKLRTPPDYYMNYLRPMLIQEVLDRHPNPYTVAFACGYGSDGETGEAQSMLIERLARQKGFPFWRLVSRGLPAMPEPLRKRAVSNVAWALHELDPVVKRRQRELARASLSARDYALMRSEW